MRKLNNSNTEVLTKDEFKALYDQNIDQLRNYVYYRIGDESLASDIIQECFLKLWTKRGEIKKNTVIALLYTIASNMLISKMRHRKVKLKFQSNYINSEAVRTPEEITIFNETKLRYERALQELPDNQRVVFLMSRIDGLKYSEISDRLGLSQKAIEKRMSKSLLHLKSKLKAK